MLRYLTYVTVQIISFKAYIKHMYVQRPKPCPQLHILENSYSLYIYPLSGRPVLEGRCFSYKVEVHRIQPRARKKHAANPTICKTENTAQKNYFEGENLVFCMIFFIEYKEYIQKYGCYACLLEEHHFVTASFSLTMSFCAKHYG